MRKVKLTILLSLLTFLLLLPTNSLASAKTEFTDVSSNNWFYNSVTDLVKKGSLKGYPDNTFRPNEDITFAEFLNLVITSATNQEFKAKENEHWAMGVYREAIFNGVIDSTNFRPDKNVFNSPITREEMAYILIGVNENLQKEAFLEELSKKSEIKDSASIDKIYLSSVRQAYEKGLLQGKNRLFKPKSNTTRAEASTVVLRLIDKNIRIK